MRATPNRPRVDPEVHRAQLATCTAVGPQPRQPAQPDEWFVGPVRSGQPTGDRRPVRLVRVLCRHAGHGELLRAERCRAQPNIRQPTRGRGRVGLPERGRPPRRHQDVLRVVRIGVSRAVTAPPTNVSTIPPPARPPYSDAYGCPLSPSRPLLPSGGAARTRLGRANQSGCTVPVGWPPSHPGRATHTRGVRGKARVRLRWLVAPPRRGT